MRNYYRRFREFASAARHTRSLYGILKVAGSQTTLNEKSLWLKALVRWLRMPVTPQGRVDEHRSQNIRLKLLVKTVEEKPEFREPMKVLITSLVKQIDPLDFFCDVGLVDSHSFFRELLYRVFLRYLPVHKRYSRLSVLAEEVFFDAGDAVWIEALDFQLLRDLALMLNFDPGFISEIRSKYLLSLDLAEKILAARLASLSSVPEFRNRVRPSEKFLLIEIPENRSAEVFARAERITNAVFNSLENSGVSIELVFLLERMRGLLSRLNLISAAIKDSSIKTHIHMFCSILQNQEEKNSVKGFLSSNLELISKKIVERAGVTGEHYIARTSKEYRWLFNSAGGGGIIMVGTTIIKSAITKLGLPLFAEGFLAWINYALSFMIIQATHCTLATKTPAMTASVLAAKLRGLHPFEAHSEFIEEVRHVFRSGLIAIAGNVIFVIMGAFVADFILFKYSGVHFLSNESAIKYLESHHLLASLTIWYAVYTGGALWFGSALGGWFENWYAYRGLPFAVEESRFLQSVFGRSGAKSISTWLSHSIMGIATNVALGFLLAFSTIFGKFFGIPLDVRHVTLSSGIIGLSLASIEQPGSHIGLILFSVSSIVFIGLLNFGVSFVISLFVAAQARNVRLKQYPRLLKKVLFPKSQEE